MNAKGQTALEYLLIVVVAIMVVVAVMVWMQSTADRVKDRGGEAVDRLVCVSYTCGNDAECKAIPACGEQGKCESGSCTIP